MKCNCRDLHKTHYKLKMSNLVISHAKATSKALETPVVGIVLAAIISKTTSQQMDRLKGFYINGPICGSREVFAGGKISSIVL